MSGYRSWLIGWVQRKYGEVGAEAVFCAIIGHKCPIHVQFCVREGCYVILKFSPPPTDNWHCAQMYGYFPSSRSHKEKGRQPTGKGADFLAALFQETLPPFPKIQDRRTSSPRMSPAHSQGIAAVQKSRELKNSLQFSSGNICLEEFPSPFHLHPPPER